MEDIIIYYINLKKDIKRNSHMISILNELNINFERIEGINGYDINLNKKYTVIHTDKFPMTRGQYGCYLSHIKCYKKFIESKYKYLIILEDDVILNKNFKESIIYLFNNYSKFLSNIDFLYLSRSNTFKEYQYKIRENYYNDDFIYSPETCGYGFFSYFLTKNGASKLLNIINKAKIHYDKINIFVPVDVMDTWTHYGKRINILLNVYALKEEITTFASMGSNTEEIH